MKPKCFFRWCDHKMEPALQKINRGYHKMETIISQKETSPLAHLVRNSLPHKSFHFCSPMRNIWNQQMGTRP